MYIQAHHCLRFELATHTLSMYLHVGASPPQSQEGNTTRDSCTKRACIQVSSHGHRPKPRAVGCSDHTSWVGFAAQPIPGSPLTFSFVCTTGAYRSSSLAATPAKQLLCRGSVMCLVRCRSSGSSEAASLLASAACRPPLAASSSNRLCTTSGCWVDRAESSASLQAAAAACQPDLPGCKSLASVWCKAGLLGHNTWGTAFAALLSMHGM